MDNKNGVHFHFDAVASIIKNTGISIDEIRSSTYFTYYCIGGIYLYTQQHDSNNFWRSLYLTDV